MLGDNIVLPGEERFLINDGDGQWSLMLGSPVAISAARTRIFRTNDGVAARVWAETWLKMFQETPIGAQDRWLNNEDSHVARCLKLEAGWFMVLAHNGDRHHYAISSDRRYQALAPMPGETRLSPEELDAAMLKMAQAVLEQGIS